MEDSLVDWYIWQIVFYLGLGCYVIVIGVVGFLDVGLFEVVDGKQYVVFIIYVYCNGRNLVGSWRIEVCKGGIFILVGVVYVENLFV